MLKANVGLSRKITRDFNSAGYTVNLEGEIPVGPDDAEGVQEKIQELFHLAEECWPWRSTGTRARPPSAAATRNARSRPTTTTTPRAAPATTRRPGPAPAGSNGPRQGQDEQATNKQVQFLLTMGKRFKLSTPQLESKVAEIIGRRCGVYDLTKREAGLVLDQLTKNNGDGREAK